MAVFAVTKGLRLSELNVNGVNKKKKKKKKTFCFLRKGQSLSGVNDLWSSALITSRVAKSEVFRQNWAFKWSPQVDFFPAG